MFTAPAEAYVFFLRSIANGNAQEKTEVTSHALNKQTYATAFAHMSHICV
jgi:hypothetical protein